MTLKFVSSPASPLNLTCLFGCLLSISNLVSPKNVQLLLQSSPFQLTTAPFSQLLGSKILVSSLTSLFLLYLSSGLSVNAIDWFYHWNTRYPSLVELLLSELRNQRDTNTISEISFNIGRLTTTTVLRSKPCALENPAHHQHSSDKEHTSVSVAQDLKFKAGTARPEIINI